MAVNTFNEEFTCLIVPHRLFHALYIDSHSLMPKIMSEIKNIDFISGDGGPGSIEQVNFIDGTSVYILIPTDTYKEPFGLHGQRKLCKYAGIECVAFGDQIDYVSHEVKFDATNDDGSICKIKTTFYLKGDVVIDEELLKVGREGYMEKFHIFIAHLTENPHLYA
ncbi:hypothetical protein MKX01_007773 [Papaver californicum]|nr:hypothetical protein MKX01_007773 [Papaver californicum]